jgi:hypothetical protein
MAVYAANLTTTDDRLRNLDHLSVSLPRSNSTCRPALWTTQKAPALRVDEAWRHGKVSGNSFSVARPSRSMLSIADFNALPSRKHDEEVQLCAFHVLAVGGKDLRKLPLSTRK